MMTTTENYIFADPALWKVLTSFSSLFWFYCHQPYQPWQAAVISENTVYYLHYLHSIKQQRDNVSN